MSRALKAATEVSGRVQRVVDRLDLRRIEARERLVPAEEERRDFIEKS